MAEFCLECLKESIGDKNLTEEDVVTEFDLCEGCGKWKPCVVAIKERNFLTEFKDMIFHAIKRMVSRK